MNCNYLVVPGCLLGAGTRPRPPLCLWHRAPTFISTMIIYQEASSQRGIDLALLGCCAAGRPHDRGAHGGRRPEEGGPDGGVLSCLGWAAAGPRAARASWLEGRPGERVPGKRDGVVDFRTQLATAVPEMRQRELLPGLGHSLRLRGATVCSKLRPASRPSGAGKL
jgi:hypothetical protein